MFNIPNVYQQFTLVAIDPGLNNIGVAVFEITADPFTIDSITATTLKEERVIERVALDSDYATERMIKRARMVEAVMTFVRRQHPATFISESPFFDARKPASFAILSDVINDIFQAVTAYDNNIRLGMVEPLLVKHTLGVAGQKGKEVVREAMETMPAIMEKLRSPIGALDEHAIDAVGVGYTYITRKILSGGKKK